MSWSAIKLQWPNQSTQWLAGLDAAKALAVNELNETARRLAALDGLATTSPGPVSEAAKAAVQAGRTAMTEQLNQPLSCLAVTPFQSGIGQGSGNQRFLSAPNLLRALSDRLLDQGFAEGQTDLQAVALLFLSNGFGELAATLSAFNSLMPVPDLVRCERRAKQLERLEHEKWELPSASALPYWAQLPLERCTLTKAAKQSLSGQLAVLEGYTADSSPMADLARLATRKAAQGADRDAQLQQLKEQLANPVVNHRIIALQIGPGSPAKLRRELLDSAPPGHEWVLCAGLLLVGPATALGFVSELVGL